MFKRAATELLSSQKDDVQSVLLASLHGKKNDDMVKILATFPHFNGWSRESIKQCCILAYIKRYLPATVITDQNEMNHGYTYFVIDGVCSVVQKVALKVRTGFGGRKLFAVCKNDSVQNENLNPRHTIFVTIRYFSNGDCFGLGEDLTNRWIISDKAVRCLIVPRDFLLQHNRNNIWPRLLQKITASFHSDARIHESLMQQVEWYRYKKEYIDHLRRRKNINGTTLEDVPYHWRICVDVPECLV